MEKEEFNNEFELVDDNDLAELTKQVAQGCTEGHLNNGEGKHIHWDLRVNVWKD